MTIGTNLSLRITAILISGFVLLNFYIIALIALPGGGADRRPFNLPRPTEVRAIVSVLERTPAAERPAVMDTFNDSLFNVRIVNDPMIQEPVPDDGLEVIRDRYAHLFDDRQITVAGDHAMLRWLLGNRPRATRFATPLSLSVPLRTGGFLRIDSRPSAVIRTYLRGRSTLGVIGGVIVLIALLFAVRQSTRPLARLSQGVRQFASSLDAPDLPESGSRELRDVAVAFNEMKGQIRGLVAERTRILAAIAHDMRTYLTRLRLRAEFIDDPGQRERAVNDLQEMSTLLDDTLLLSARDEDTGPSTAAVAIDETLERLIEVRQDLGEPVTLMPVAPGTTVLASPVALRRVLTNLIDNGLRHGGAVTVSAQTQPGQAIVELRIEDDGPGVPEEALARLGEPFRRLDPSRNRDTGGAGLGLAIVRALATRDGACLTFANRPEGGFCVTLRYPAAR